MEPCTHPRAAPSRLATFVVAASVGPLAMHAFLPALLPMAKHFRVDVGPASPIAIGNGMALPNANPGIVSGRPHMAGLALGFVRAMTMTGAAVLAAVASSVLSIDAEPFQMLWIVLGSAVTATLTSLLVIRRTQQVGELP